MILYLFYNIFLDYDFVLGICDDVVVDLLDNLLGMFMIIMIIMLNIIMYILLLYIYKFVRLLKVLII